MTLRFTFQDGDSSLKVVFGEGGVTIYRPTRGFTPSLEVMAGVLSGMACTTNDQDEMLAYVRQAKDMTVLVGEDKCG